VKNRETRPARRLAASLVTAGALLAAAAPAWADPGDADPAPAPGQSQDAAPTVDMVICLDESGSMSGLIDACRRKIWDMCTLLAQARPEPRLRVALLTYGDDPLVRRRIDLTDDLDRVYEELMAVQTGGGTELVGRVVKESLDGLTWSDDAPALKLLFVAGNESADQDREHDFRAQCRRALQESVVVHAIYCGAEDAGDAASWREVARIGGGAFAAIDQEGTVQVETPFDEELTRLSSELNATYLPYGAQGEAGCQRQRAQDANARESGGAATAAARARTKASGLYANGSWDLVDASQAEGFAWSDVAEEDLPEELRGKTAAEKQAAIDARLARRAELQERIQALDVERQAFIAAELERREGAERSLDFAMARAIRAEAEDAGLRFD